MKAIFVKNTYNKLQKANNIDNSIVNISLLDKFALKVFNRLTYDHEISNPLIASTLLSFSDYYTLSYNVKSININIFYNYFLEFALHGYN